MKTARISVPGKIHLIGEHTVVYGRPALIASIDRRCFVSIKLRNDTSIQIISKNYNLDLSINLNKIAVKRESARKSWEKFINTKDISFLTSITKEPLDYPFLVVAEVLKFYDASLKHGFSLEIDSQIPIGAGSGSSSAIAVSIVSAITLLLGKPLDREVIFQIAVKAEELKHGTPSGGDPATVLHGGFIWFQKISTTERIIKPIALNNYKKVSSSFYIVDTGKPEESTGEMIAIVRKFKDMYPDDARKIFDDQEDLTNAMLEALQSNNDKDIIKIIKKAEDNLEKLGVVSGFVKQIIRDIEDAGGVAKISGGGGRMKGTGLLLVYHKDEERLKIVLDSHGLSSYNILLGVEGLREENYD